MKQINKNWRKVSSSEYWSPIKEGESIEGELIDIVVGNFGKQYVIKNQDTGKIIVTPSHKVLQNQMATVKVGEIVKIEFTEEIPATVKGRNDTKMYETYVLEEDDNNTTETEAEKE